MSSLKPKTAGGTAVRKYPKNWRWGLLFILPCFWDSLFYRLTR